MAVQNPFFGKRDPEPFHARTPSASSGMGHSGAASISGLNNAHQGASAATPPLASTAAAATEGSGSKLTVGPNIKLKGVEITDCDTLVVEGTVEATMDSRVIQIAHNGAFKGAAEIDVAEIRGVFEGKLTVREKLVVFGTGKVSGTVRYGKLVVEEGGQISGEIQAGFAPATGAVPAASAAAGGSASAAVAKSDAVLSAV